MHFTFPSKTSQTGKPQQTDPPVIMLFSIILACGIYPVLHCLSIRLGESDGWNQKQKQKRG
jgi:hypothetical protein